MSIVVQQEISEFLRYLELKLSPQPLQVVRHLLKCSQDGNEPPGGVYRWLNDNAQSSDIDQLQNSACLHIDGKYLRPDQIFWGQHNFGRFRVQLGTDIRSYQNLLQLLRIREAPDYWDAFEVLKDVYDEVGNNPLAPEDKNVVLRCWVMLSDALEHGKVNDESVRTPLQDVKCVPNSQELLQLPSWMFFEDRPELATKFTLLKNNRIQRTEHVWSAMAAAGVRSVSDVVLGSIEEAVNPQEDEGLKKRVIERIDLIKTISNVEIQLDSIRLIHVDKLMVKWRLQAFDRIELASPGLESAFLDRAEESIYFASQSEAIPWAAISRELAQAIAPGQEIKFISPGIKVVLEAHTHSDAVSQLRDLGIAPTEELGDLDSQGYVAEMFDENAEPEYTYEHEPVPTDMPANGIQDVSSQRTLDRQDRLEVPFAKKLMEAQIIGPTIAPDRPVLLPGGGPQTGESAKRHTKESIQIGRSGANVSSTIKRWQPTEAANDLAEEFRRMVQGDYGKRCQICSRTFTKPDGEPQVFVVHVVEPSADHRTNHFGNLLGLCGWHYALLRHGEWAFLDPETNQPFDDSDESEGWEQMRIFMAKAPQQIDEVGNPYIDLPIRFWNVYQDWASSPLT